MRPILEAFNAVQRSTGDGQPVKGATDAAADL